MKFYAQNHQCKLQLQNAWAKTDKDGEPALSVRAHCINVGAVALELGRNLSPKIKSLLPIGSELIVASHDIGKISPGFLMKSVNWREKWQDSLGLDSPDMYESFHAKVSQHFLSRLPGLASKWLVSVGGHHGKYCSSGARVRLNGGDGGEVFERLRKELWLELQRNFGSFEVAKPRSEILVHFFTGFMIFSDWVGSSETWFPLCQTSELTKNVATKRAEAAVRDIGWGKREVSASLSFGELFRADDLPCFKPLPLQSALIDAVDTSGLYILEAPMGGGKTEAALAAAYRRWTEGEERGLYFALPTQLTSNRIHERIKSFLCNVVSGVSPLSIIHGNAWLSPERMTAVLPTGSSVEDDASESNRWFSDNRKAMLAPFGTGTIDQALMAAMPVKFSALRFFALGGKVVVIDEVHSYDPYTSALVDRTAQCLLEVGCTVIVLSATLTRSRRAQLVAAAGAKEEKISDSYPLLTKVATGSSVAQSIDIEGVDTRNLEVIIDHESVLNENWMTFAAKAAESGACVLIVRNTVALSQDCFRLLKARCREGKVEFGLLHSRFPQFQREENETTWMEKLGRGTSKRPKGCILVGTQVLEQSVDIDADLLITDLAPSDLLLQRIGRLHRHKRKRPDGFQKARCIILEPEVNWEEGEKEIKSAIGPSAYVYSPFVLFQAQRVWSELKLVSLPNDIRDILESAEEIPATLPSGAKVVQSVYAVETKKQINTALNRDIFEMPVPDVEGMETRWGMRPTAYVVLLKSRPCVSGKTVSVEFLNGATIKIKGWGFDFQLARLLHLNAVRVSRYLVADTLKNEDSGLQWLQAHISGAVLAVCDDDTSECIVENAPDVCSYALSYHRERGLTYEKNEGAPVNYDEPEEDSWY